MNKFTDCQCKDKAFTDRLAFDAATKTVISVRDGVQEYLGSEIGAEPKDKVFTVYRSPATVSSVALKMQALPLTDNHIAVGGPVDAPVGEIISSDMVDLFDTAVDSKLGIKNEVKLSDAMMQLVQDGKRELSLGYNAELVEHDQYDFEQRDIVPHHLAVVDAGRCGSACSFLDNEGSTMNFFDDDGAVNVERVAEIAVAMPEALKKMPLAELAKVMPKLQEIAAIAKPAAVEPAPVPTGDEEGEEDDKLLDGEPKPAEDGEKFEDSAKFKDAVKAAADAAVATHATVMQKAVKFLDADYDFTGKDTDSIMRDALATQHDTKFADAELAVAFKMLTPSSKYPAFGDAKHEVPTSLSARLDKELEA